jgi:endoglucanase
MSSWTAREMGLACRSVRLLRAAMCALAATAISTTAQATCMSGQGGELPLLSTRGGDWVDTSGSVVRLRGCNLGNWLLQEMWMHAMRTEGIPDQYTLQEVLARRFGEERKDDLLRTYRANFITARDFATIKSFGMNVIRLPIWCGLLEDDAHPRQLRPDAWQDIDRAIALAEAEGIYTILDLHGAPGGQNPWDHNGGPRYDKLWGSEEYKQRTVWLWEQIAARYRNRTAVAGYDLLNEPYTAPEEEIRDLLFDCYRAIRAVDPDHIVVFPWVDGFGFYGDLKGPDMHNVALTPHFYPGFFGWGEPTPQVHQDWLKKGVQEWRDRAAAFGVPVLVGEMNVVLKSAGGPEMMRHSFDTYAGFGWATTMWSYKVFTAQGGLGDDGSWGMVTNPPGEGQPLVKADTWHGIGWDSLFAEAGVRSQTSFVVPGEGETTVYLVLKAGAAEGGRLDIAVTGLTLADATNGQPVAIEGDAWVRWHHAGDLTVDSGCGRAGRAEGEGVGVRFHGAGFVNGGVYRALTLVGGREYSLSGSLRDLGSSPDAAWVEVYLRLDPPREGADYLPQPAPGARIDISHSTFEEIKGYFQSLSEMQYVVYEDLRHWLTTPKPPAPLPEASE